jgi:hypothetical protein
MYSHPEELKRILLRICPNESRVLARSLLGQGMTMHQLCTSTYKAGVIIDQGWFRTPHGETFAELLEERS